MNKEEQSLYDTHQHTVEVSRNLAKITKNLIDRSTVHDLSKFENPEREVFAENNEKLGLVEFGSEAYKNLLQEVKPAIDHHYAVNRHHPQHHKNGVEDMTLCDIVEMLCDWKAATARNKNGNIRKSIEINAEKYNIPPMLRKILENTVKEELA